MEFKLVLGVDISKEWFDFCLMNSEFDIIWEAQVKNNPEDIYRFLSEFLAKGYATSFKDVLLCLEHTGIYVQHLIRCYLSKGGRVCMVPAAKVSEQLNGKVQWDEKTDSMDARRLAEYAFRFADKLKMWKAQDPTLVKLQAYQRQRERFLNALKMFQMPVNESKSFDSIDISEALEANQAATIEALNNDLKRLEKAINNLIESDEHLSRLFELITSVEGVGAVTAREIIIATCGFAKFQPNEAKAFARFAGVIPLKREFGKSFKKRQTVGKRANKKIKSLLTMGGSVIDKQRT